MKNNRVLEKEIFGNYKLVPLKLKDMFLIKEWRNQQLDILRQKVKLTDEDQKKYFNDVVLPAYEKSKPRHLLFGIIYKKDFIAYGGFTNIDWSSKRAEVSFLDSTERSQNEKLYAQDFTSFLILIKKLAFSALKLHRIFTETYDIRPQHVNILENNGFIFEGRLKHHVHISGKYVDSLIHGCLSK